MLKLLSKLLFTICTVLTVLEICIFNLIDHNQPREYAFNRTPAVFAPTTWIFNQRVAQYSTRVIYDHDSNRLIVEALAFFAFDFEKEKIIKARVRCLVLVNDLVYILSIYETIGIETTIPNGLMTRLLWKVRCELPNKLTTLNQFKVALIDFKEFQPAADKLR